MKIAYGGRTATSAVRLREKPCRIVPESSRCDAWWPLSLHAAPSGTHAEDDPIRWSGGWLEPETDPSAEAFREATWIWYPEEEPARAAPVGKRGGRYEISAPVPVVIHRVPQSGPDGRTRLADVNVRGRFSRRIPLSNTLEELE